MSARKLYFVSRNFTKRVVSVPERKLKKRPIPGTGRLRTTGMKDETHLDQEDGFPSWVHLSTVPQTFPEKPGYHIAKGLMYGDGVLCEILTTDVKDPHRRCKGMSSEPGRLEPYRRVVRVIFSPDGDLPRELQEQLGDYDKADEMEECVGRFLTKTKGI